MNFAIFFIGCLIIVLPRNAESFEIINDFISAIFYQTPLTNIRHLEIAESIKNNYVVKDTMGLAEQYKYSAAKHTVTTEDGYILIFFRISGSPTVPSADGKPVVFIQHGVGASSDSWALFGHGYDLAFLLVAKGYDVWIGNARGTTYGRNHINLTTDDEEFWNYSFHEIGMWDISAMINHILQETGQTDLVYIGHSMGTTAMYILLSEKPEYNDKVRLMVSLAPIAFWENSLNLFWTLACDNYYIIKVVLNALDINDLFSRHLSKDTLGDGYLCESGSITQFLCIFIVTGLFGNDVEEFDWGLLPYITLYNPAGVSLKTLLHYQQNINAVKFRRWDYGQTDNAKIYGTNEPPDYNVTKISAPCAFIYSHKDPLAQEKSVVALARRVENVVALEEVPYYSFNHLDFMWATNAKALLYNRVIDLISKYSP